MHNNNTEISPSSTSRDLQLFVPGLLYYSHFHLPGLGWQVALPYTSGVAFLTRESNNSSHGILGVASNMAFFQTCIALPCFSASSAFFTNPSGCRHRN